jgi:hypothetical protein
VKSVDLLKVLNYNDSTTFVEVPCSAKQSGFKQQARQSRWCIAFCGYADTANKLVVVENVDVEMVDERR